MAKISGECIKTVVAIVVAACVGLAVLSGYRGKLFDVGKDGERTYYLHSASSQATMKRDISLDELFCVYGESVAFVDEGLVDERKAKALKELQECGAMVLFEETVDGVWSVYGYLPSLYEPVVVKGEKVNLHIAISKTRTVVGSPIVFGGY